MYKGFYEAVLRLDFCLDEKTDGLLPFLDMKRHVEDGGVTRILTEFLEYHMEPTAKVTLTQTGAELMNIPERRTKHVQ